MSAAAHLNHGLRKASQARSPWVEFIDENNVRASKNGGPKPFSGWKRPEWQVKLYYNILTTESRIVSRGFQVLCAVRWSGASRRDKPLAVINEPIEDNKGGGLVAVCCIRMTLACPISRDERGLVWDMGPAS